MARIHIQTPGALPMDVAMNLAYAFFGIPPMSGASTDGWSKMNDFLRCPYRFYLRHELGATIKPDALMRAASAPDIGGLMHAALALRYARMLPEGYPGWAPVLPSPTDFIDKVEELGAELLYVQEVRRLYYAYEEHYGVEDIQPVAVEYSSGQVGVHTCRYDMVGWDQGSLWIYEHKTAAYESADVLESWWLDGEIIGEVYAWHQQNLNEVFQGNLVGVKINLIFKTVTPKFRQLEVVFPQKILDSFIGDRQYWAQLRDGMRRRGHWPRSLQGCMSRYDMCQFWAHCRDEDHSLLEIREVPQHAKKAG